MDIKSKPTFVLRGHPLLFVCLFDNMLVCSFSCFLSFACLPCLFAQCFLYLFVYLFFLSLALPFHCLLHVYTWSTNTTYKMQAKKCKNTSKMIKLKKGNDQQTRRLSLFEWFSLPILAFSVEPCLQLSRLGIFFLVSCLGRILKVWQCLIYLSCTLPLYPLDIGNV